MESNKTKQNQEQGYSNYKIAPAKRSCWLAINGQTNNSQTAKQSGWDNSGTHEDTQAQTNAPNDGKNVYFTTLYN